MLSARQKRRLIALARKVLEGKEQYDSNGNGVCAVFYKLTESFGVKVMKYYGAHKTYMRDIFVRQRRAWRLGLAPYCFGFQEFTFRFEGDDVTTWGYITEIAIVLNDHEGYSWGKSDVSSSKPGARLRRLLWSKLEFEFHDCHGNNVGVLRGQWVCIDFGDE